MQRIGANAHDSRWEKEAENTINCGSNAVCYIKWWTEAVHLFNCVAFTENSFSEMDYTMETLKIWSPLQKILPVNYISKINVRMTEGKKNMMRKKITWTAAAWGSWHHTFMKGVKFRPTCLVTWFSEMYKTEVVSDLELVRLFVIWWDW